GEGRNSAIVEAIIKMARANGLQTTAEGVETNQQRDALKSLGCDNIQGFLMSRPMARADVTVLLQMSALPPSRTDSSTAC
ncbi:EAL domain-containing protein, partial [Agrobacterium sp. lyk4-40-TYG-31]